MSKQDNTYDMMSDEIEAAVLASGQRNVYVINSTYKSDADNEQIYGRLCGLSAEEIKRLEAEEII